MNNNIKPQSILVDIKKMLNISNDDNSFDTDIIIHINSIFTILHQLGVGPTDGFEIKDESTQWYEYIDDMKIFNTIKSYIYLRVKMLFDPAMNGTVLETQKQTIAELEWRLTNSTN